MNSDHINADLLLSSSSARRVELLRQIGVRFLVRAVQVEERCGETESAVDYVRRLAVEKAQAGWQQQEGNRLPSLGADTLGLLDGDLLEKPRDLSHSIEMLERMSGRTHEVLSAVALYAESGVDVRLSRTAVRFRTLTRSEIERYWRTGEPADKAGSYGIQGFGAVFVESIHGSYSGVVGLPLAETRELLIKHNIPLWNSMEPGNE